MGGGESCGIETSTRSRHGSGSVERDGGFSRRREQSADTVRVSRGDVVQKGGKQATTRAKPAHPILTTWLSIDLETWEHISKMQRL